MTETKKGTNSMTKALKSLTSFAIKYVDYRDILPILRDKGIFEDQYMKANRNDLPSPELFPIYWAVGSRGLK